MYLPAILGIVSLGLLVMMQRRVASLIAFSVFAFTLAFWLLPQYLAQLFPTSDGYTISLRLLQLDSAIANLCALSFLVFILLYTGLWKKYRRSVWLVSAMSVIFIAFNFTSLMITEVETKWNGIAIKEVGVLYTVQLVFLAMLFISGVVGLLRSTSKLPYYQRSSNYLLILAIGQGIGVSLLGSIFFASSIMAQVFAPFALLLLVAIIGFAIIKHRLFDIHLIVARAMGYVLSLLILGAIFVTGGVALGRVFFGYEHVPQSVIILYSSLALFVAFVFQPVKQRFDKLSNRIFYQDAYDAQEFFNELNNILVSTLNLEKLVSDASGLVVTRMKTDYCALVLLDRDGKKFRVLGRTGSLNPGDLETIYKKVLSKGRKQQTIIVDALDGQGYRESVELLNRNGVAIMSELKTAGNHQAVGYMIVGRKKSGNLYSHQDIRVFEAMTDGLAIAIQNTLRFEEIERFNETLQRKVDDATRKLRESNKKLKKLNESKDDFISMTSHQLRTPLTSIKGYISLVMDEDGGKINETQLKLLKQAFSSSQKMVYLIADLLNVSRLKTGKFTIERKPTDLVSLVKDEMAQVAEEAASRGLEMTQHLPKEFPTLPLDNTKTRQVVMNFLDNAIYYTPSGGNIRVELKELPKSVEFRVIDDGIGVPKDERHHLFAKFYRAKNALRTRPDGTGLGLYMAKKVIAAQGGALIFDSIEGKGSTFGFMFPKDLPQEGASVVSPATIQE
jgi:signal transduction histidine kinase